MRTTFAEDSPYNRRAAAVGERGEQGPVPQLLLQPRGPPGRFAMSPGRTRQNAWTREASALELTASAVAIAADRDSVHNTILGVRADGISAITSFTGMVLRDCLGLQTQKAQGYRDRLSPRRPR